MPGSFLHGRTIRGRRGCRCRHRTTRSSWYVIALDGDGYRLYYEAPLADGSHELRTAAVPPAP